MSLKSFEHAQLMGLRSTTACLILIYLNEVDGNPGMTRLASMCRVSTAALTGQIDSLTRHGFLERQQDPDDRRRYIIKLTETGEAVADQLNPETPCNDTIPTYDPETDGSVSLADMEPESTISEGQQNPGT